METFIDSRDGRARSDNVPQPPAFEFMGNFAGTAAVQAWILSDVVQRGAGAR